MAAKQALKVLGLFTVGVLLVAGCAQPIAAPTEVLNPAPAVEPTTAQTDQPTAAPTEAPAATQALQIPNIVQGKFNVAVVLVGFHADGGWSQSHTESAQWMAQQDPTINVVVLDTVNPGPDAESAMRSLARKGFDLIIGTTYEYGPTMDGLSQEFPKTSWLHVSGVMHNDTNYGNVYGSMEQMCYLAGMVGGARAKADGNTKLGYVAPWPLPGIIRLGNAFMLGAKVTCPECTMEVRWINTWYDPDKEKEAAQSLLDSGVDVLLVTSDTPGPLVAASNAGKWAFTPNYVNSCNPAPDKCLGSLYWDWGSTYLDIVKQIRAGTWKPGFDFRTGADGIVGLSGFMQGQTPQPGVPEDVIPLVEAKLMDMMAGKFTVQDVFRGPIKDNAGEVIIPEGQTLTPEDLYGINDAMIKSMNLTGFASCPICMNFLVDGIQGTIPPMPQ